MAVCVNIYVVILAVSHKGIFMSSFYPRDFESTSSKSFFFVLFFFIVTDYMY